MKTREALVFETVTNFHFDNLVKYSNQRHQRSNFRFCISNALFKPIGASDIYFSPLQKAVQL